MSQPQRGLITAEQYPVLMSPLRGTRTSERKLGGKSFSYLESWDVRAHLTRIFGFGNFDAEVIDSRLIGVYEYQSGGENKRTMVEVMWQVTFRLVIRDPHGNEIARYAETAVGSATKAKDGAGLGDIHDNAVKSGTSDALKRCAINLGTQFGLSLYNGGGLHDVVKKTVVTPAEYVEKDETNPEAQDQINASLNQQVAASDEATNEVGMSDEDVAAGLDAGVNPHDAGGER